LDEFLKITKAGGFAINSALEGEPDTKRKSTCAMRRIKRRHVP
jgi:hypothetical protein